MTNLIFLLQVPSSEKSSDATENLGVSRIELESFNLEIIFIEHRLLMNSMYCEDSVVDSSFLMELKGKLVNLLNGDCSEARKLIFNSFENDYVGQA